MSRSKKLYLLLGVLAEACIATFAVMRYEERKEQIRNSDEIILELPSDSGKICPLIPPRWTAICGQSAI